MPSLRASEQSQPWEKRQGTSPAGGLADTALGGSLGWEDRNSNAGLTSQAGRQRPSSPRKREAQNTCPTLCPNWLSAESISPLAVLRRLWASGPAEEGAWEAVQPPDGDAGGLLPGVGGKVGEGC